MVEVDSRLAMTAGLARWRPWSRDGPMPVTGRLTAAKCAELVVKKTPQQAGGIVDFLFECPKPRAEPDNFWQAWQLEPGSARLQPR